MFSQNVVLSFKMIPVGIFFSFNLVGSSCFCAANMLNLLKSELVLAFKLNLGTSDEAL